ncbi:hypothetical protein BOVMAS07_13810 [Streptococcus uberis]
MITVVGNMELLNAITGIEIDFKEDFPGGLTNKYQHIYKDKFDQRLCILLSSLHNCFVEVLTIMNKSINGNKYFWADPSRDLLKIINLSNRLVDNINKMGDIVSITTYYDEVIQKCNSFLRKSGGSTVPEDMREIIIYYELPIFEVSDIISLPSNFSKKFNLKPIGNGSYATVYSYFDENYNKQFALKRAKATITSKDLDRFYLEFEMMKKLNSPYFIEVYSIDKQKNEYIMEYADISLYDYIKSKNQKLTFEERKSLCHQIIKGFEYLHEKEMFHRDVSPKNVLIKEYDDVKIIKIADLGNVKLNDSVLTALDTEIRGFFNDSTGLQRVGFSKYDFNFEGFALCRLIYFVLTGRHSDFSKFEYNNLKEFIDKGTNPDFSIRFKNIQELKQWFIRIKPK